MAAQEKLPLPQEDGPQPDGTTWVRVNGTMYLLPRTPEWEAKDNEDKARYGISFRPMPASDLMEMPYPPETTVHGFRRGYRDTGVVAVQKM